jgi:hypothetical protein
MLLMLNLMTSIYWGQLSHCLKLPYELQLAQYSCSNYSAYGVTSAFAALLFVSQTALVSSIVLWRAELIQEMRNYVGVAQQQDGQDAKSSGTSTIIFNHIGGAATGSGGSAHASQFSAEL